MTTEKVGTADRKIKLHGYDPVEMSKHLSMDDLVELNKRISREHSNPYDECRKSYMERDRSTIHLLDKRGRQKADKVGWAIYHKLSEKNRVIEGSKYI